MKTIPTVYFLANASIYLTDGATGILIDGFLDDYQYFDSIPSDIEDAIMKKRPPFESLSTLIFTHKHPDHYSPGKLISFLKCYPKTEVYLPDTGVIKTNDFKAITQGTPLNFIPENDQISQQAVSLISENNRTSQQVVSRISENNRISQQAVSRISNTNHAAATNFNMNRTFATDVYLSSCSFTPASCKHLLNKYDLLNHDALFLNYNDCTFFFSGDADPVDLNKRLTSVSEPLQADYAFVSPFFMSLTPGQRFLTSISPKKVFIYHMPVQVEDVYRYNEILQRGLKRSKLPEEVTITPLVHLMSELIL